MKQTRTWIWLTVLSLLLTLWAPATVVAETPTPVVETTAPVAASAQQEDLFYFGRSALAQMPNGDALCYAYDKLVAGCESVSDYVDITHGTHHLTYDEALLVWETVTSDHPAFFWLIDRMQFWGSSANITAFDPNIPADLEMLHSALDQRVAELTAGLENKSDYEKSLILHDRVTKAVTYTFSPNDQTIIGSLLEGKSVCAGYARGYQILMQAVGIPCFYVTGHSRGQGHAWNLVQLDGEWYYTDVTWDDPDDGDFAYYSYLNLPYAWMAEDHTPTAFTQYLPQSTATKHNFYVKNNLVVEPDKEPNLAQLAEGLKATYPPQFYYRGDSNEGFLWIFEHLDTIIYEMVGEYAMYDGSFSALGHGIVLHVKIDHDHHYTSNEISAPTCTDEGQSTLRCEGCGHTTVDTVAALGHDMTLWQDETHHKVYCQRCDLVTDHSEHTFDGDTCTHCGYVQAPAILLGDATGDGDVDNRDLGRLQQYLNEWDVSIQEAACDMNGDGEINNRDLGRLQQYLNGWFD